MHIGFIDYATGRLFFCWMLLIVFVFPLSVRAQEISQPNRYERTQKNSDDYFSVISLQNHGIALFRERDKFKSSNRLWELVFLDADLNERKTTELEIKERHKLIGYEVDANNLYFLFRTGETTKNDLELIRIGFEGVELNRYAIKPDLDFRLTHFIKTGANFVFGGYVNQEPAVLVYEPQNNVLKVLPGFFQKDTELVELRTNVNQTFNTVLVDRSSRDDRKLVFRTYDETGKQLMEDIVIIEEDRTLQTGITSALEREDLIVLGTWSERNAKSSRGFYSLTINPFADQKIQYFDFAQLDHYLDYLNPKRAQKIRSNALKARTSGRTPTFTSHVMPIKLTEYNNGFILLAEVYNPVSNNAYNPHPFYGPGYYPYGMNPYWPGYYYPGMGRLYRPYNYGPNVRNNDEVKSIETVLVSFDANGKVLWDQSVKLEEMKRPGIEQVSDFNLDGRSISFIYKKESELKIKRILLGDEEATREMTEKIKTLDPQDDIRSEKPAEGGVRHWSGNTFYVWGYQTIRNNTKTERVRDVFYINKIIVQ